MSTFPSAPDDIQDDVANTTFEQDLHPSLHNEMASAINAVETSLLSGGSFSLTDHLAAADPHPQYATEGLFLPLAGGSMTGPIKAANGSLAAPSYSFTNQPDGGLWLSGSDLTLSTPGYLVLKVGNTAGWYFDYANGSFYANQDNAFDIGKTTANRPRDLFLGRDLYASGSGRFDGTLGIGFSPLSYRGYYIGSAKVLTGSTSQSGVFSAATMGSGATFAGAAFEAILYTQAAAFTMTSGYGLRIQSPLVGAGSAITSNHGIYVHSQGATGITNAYGVYIAAQTGAATTNIGLRNAGSTQLDGSVGFFATAPQAKKSVSGSRAGNAALASLLTQLAAYGLITDGSSA